MGWQLLSRRSDIGRLPHLLKEKLGALLFQFPRFSQFEFKGRGPLLSRLRVFLRRATEAHKVQIRRGDSK